MNILFAASEAVPFCKTGGLADVAGTLPLALARRGCRAALMLPYYRVVREAGIAVRSAGWIRVPIAGEEAEAELLRAEHAGLTVYFVDFPRFFDRDGLYGPSGGDFEDNALRYAFFSRAVLEGARLAGLGTDVIHCHDWQTGLVPVYLRTLYREDDVLGRAGTVLTVHNIAYQGVFEKESLAAAGLPPDLYDDARLKHYDRISFLKGGLVYADVLNTVSVTYAEEIQTKRFGCALEETVRSRRADLHGVLNGLDLDFWDPSADKALARRYAAPSARKGKEECKAALQKECGFDALPRTPLIASVTRLDHQKGLDVALEILPRFLEKGAQYVIIGTGALALEKGFAELARRYPGRAHYRGSFDDPFAHRVYAGADVFLMPSRFEPCGLGQMIAMRYGAVPVAVRTGGLADTVPPHGFLAASAEAHPLESALDEALRYYAREEGWDRRVRAAMEADFAWDRSAGRYMELYRFAMRGDGAAD